MLSAKATMMFLCFLILTVSMVASAQQADPLPSAPLVRGGTVELSLGEAIALVLERNLEIELERYFPLIAAEDVVFERGAFDPVLSSMVSYGESEEQGGVQFRNIYGAEGFETREVEWNTELRKKTTLGTEAAVGYELSRDDLIVSGVRDEDGVSEPFRFHTEEYRSRLYVDLNQPLLKGFGTNVNTAGIRIARNREEAAFLLFLDRVEEVLAGTQKAYWQLAFAEGTVRIAEQSLALAESFLRIAEARFRAGTAIQTDVLQAKADVADREANLLQAQNLLRDSEDVLRSLLRLTDTREEWLVVLRPTELPVTLPSIPPLDESITEAFANRYDYQVAKLDLADRGIQATLTRNAQYPVLDLFSTLAGLGLDDSPGKSLSTVGEGDFYEVTVGARFSYPLGNQAALGQHRRALWEQKQAGVSLELLEDQIIREVREAWRHIDSDMKRIEARERARVFAEQKLEAEQKRYDVGRATSTDVLDFQEDVTVARVQELRARIDYVQSWINLDRSKGTVAERAGVKVEELKDRQALVREPEK